MITESATVSPPPTTWIAAAMSIGPSCRSTKQATTAIWPANIAAKTNRPHSAVPQNFQIRGGRLAGADVTADCGIEGVHQGFRIYFVMAGLDPGIHVFLLEVRRGCRHKAGHDDLFQAVPAPAAPMSSLARSTAPYMLA